MGKTPVQANLIDKIVTFFDPVRGAARQRARTMLAVSGGYSGARRDSRELRDWLPWATSADDASLLELPILRARSRDLERNTPIGGGAVLNAKKNVVGTGLSFHPTPNLEVLGWTEEQGEAWADILYRKFDRWASSKDSDVTRTQNFYESQGLVYHAKKSSGDCVVLLPMVTRPGVVYSTCFQVVEADRLASPAGDGRTVQYGPDDARKTSRPIYGGVEKDEYGAPIAYYILRKHPSSIGFYAPTAQWDRFAAFGAKSGRRNVLHVFDRERPDQSRGIPYLAPVIEALKQLSRLSDSELMAAVVSAMFTAILTSPDAETIGDDKDPPEMKLGAGTIVRALPGEEVSFADPKRPNAAFDPFYQAIVKQVAVRIEQPYEALMMHFQSSYTAARAALLELWKFVVRERYLLETQYCQPVIEAWMDEAVALREIIAPGYFDDPEMRAAYLSGEWVGDAAGQVDPVKEVNAAKARIELRISSRKRESMALNGSDWKDNHRQVAREHRMGVEDGLEPPVLGATATEPITPDEEVDDTAPKPKPDQQEDGDE